MSKQAISKVNKLFPSCNELMNDEQYKMGNIIHPMTLFAFKNSLQWEGVTQAVGNMLTQMFELGYVSYYDFDNVTGKGSAGVYDAQGRVHTIEGLDKFKALTKIMYMSVLGMPLTDEQRNAMYEFKCSDSKLIQIMD